MKYILKIFLIVLLVVAIIGAACWFFLVQRPDLTMSVFAHWGDYFYDAGRYNRAVSLYETACKLSPENANLPVRLAQAYINSGNYTKAEYTLVSAITNNPESVQLYVALSKTYIEQDKILDAEQMLDRITSADVKAQIDALRPNVPVLSPESGYYSEYIDVSALATGGTAYLAVNQDYPSIKTDAYEAPVTLEAGDSKVVVVTVAENGLVSDAVYGGYTIGSVVEEVKLSDSALDGYVRELLGKSASDTIMSDELWEIEELTLPEGVQDISGPQNAHDSECNGARSLGPAAAHDAANARSFGHDAPDLDAGRHRYAAGAQKACSAGLRCYGHQSARRPVEPRIPRPDEQFCLGPHGHHGARAPERPVSDEQSREIDHVSQQLPGARAAAYRKLRRLAPVEPRREHFLAGACLIFPTIRSRTYLSSQTYRS